MRRLGPAAVIAAVALLAWAPTLALSAPGDSFGYDLNWSRQFSALFLRGELYPRWTPASFGGLGSPTFYFYPPLAFWLTGLIAGAGHGALSATLTLKLAMLALIGASGGTMFAWLRLEAAAPSALAGACFYMLAPYHLDDHYVRGAFAELSTFPLLPIVALGLAKTAAGRRAGPLWLALGWAGLVLAHLPIALLTGVFLAAPYGLSLAIAASGARRWTFVGTSAAAVLVGAGLAAIYLAPALELQGAISSGYWWSDKFQAAERLFLNPAAWRMPLEPFLAVIAGVEAGLAAIVGARLWRGGARTTALWAALALLVFAALCGVVPGLWSLPLLAKVQFPWRAIAVEEFALATLLAWAGRSAASPLVWIGAAALVIGNGAAVAKDLASPQRQGPGYGATSFPTSVDAPEYLPRGLLRMAADGPAPVVDIRALAARPLASGPAARWAAPEAGGGVRVELANSADRRIVLARFYFPSWRVTCDGVEVAAAAVTPARLVGFAPPPGARSCEARIGSTGAERVGGAIGLAAVLALVLYALWAFAPRARFKPAAARSAAG